MANYEHETTLRTPGPVSCLSFGRSDGLLYAGADDGTLRVYQLPSPTAKKAIRGLGEVSSVVAAMPLAGKDANAEEAHFVWVASGPRVRGLSKLRPFLTPKHCAGVPFQSGDSETSYHVF
jgi:hypothetical protein